MEVVEQQAAWLSDYEVLEHLREQKSQRDLVSKNLGRPVQAAENVQTLEFEALGYLEKHCALLTAERLQKLMEYMASLSLTKAEKLQIVNVLPKTQVEFYLIVEECEERFTNEQVDDILAKITDILATIPNIEIVNV